MGMHFCEYCDENAKSSYRRATNMDVVVDFPERSYIFPEMILHYVFDHGYIPPADFILDVLENEYRFDLSSGDESREIRRIGYLSGDYPRGVVNEEFVSKLEQIIADAIRLKAVIRYRGVYG